MRTMAFGAAIAGLLVTANSGARAACSVADFEVSGPAAVSQVQQLAFATSVTEAGYDTIKHDQARAGGYEVIAGSVSYADLQARIEQRKAALNLATFDDYRSSWAESALDDAGLQAYETCLKAAGGFFATLSTLDETTTKLSIDWYPGAAGTIAKPVIVASKNIDNVEGLNYTLSQGAWGTSETRLELRILRKDRNKAAELTLSANNHATLKYLPQYIKTPINIQSKKRSTLAKIFGN